MNSDSAAIPRHFLEISKMVKVLVVFVSSLLVASGFNFGGGAKKSPAKKFAPKKKSGGTTAADGTVSTPARWLPAFGNYVSRSFLTCHKTFCSRRLFKSARRSAQRRSPLKKRT